MKKILLVIGLSFLMAGCLPPNSPTAQAASFPAPSTTSVRSTPIDLSKVHGATLINCTNKLDNSHLVYLKSDRTDKQSSLFNSVTLSEIIDVQGKHWVINQYQWRNYKCVSKELK